MAPGPLEVGWVGIWGRELGPGTRKGRKPSLFPVVFFFFFSLSFFSCYLCVCIMWFSEEEVGLAPPTLIPPPPCLHLRFFSHHFRFTVARLFLVQAEGLGVTAELSVSA